MLSAPVILLVSLLYLGVLFAIASWGDRRADQGRSVIGSPHVYTLSLAVYCTAWTFYGSVGLAARQGLTFLPIYLGPTLATLLFGFILRKMLRVTKAYGITSIADFVASRYGKSAPLGGIVTIVAILGAIPYIALQLKALAASVDTVLGAGDAAAVAAGTGGADTALFVALLLALFSMLFGTRHIDATEHHQGMVLAVAFESVVKLAAFLLAGAYVTNGMFDGFGDIFAQAARHPLGPPLTVGGGAGYTDWLLVTAIAGLAFLFLDRQFQVAVIENVDEAHLRTASWLLPAYLLLINLFVLPVALAGVIRGSGDADLYVLNLPLSAGADAVALLTYLGGLSASTAMIIVATVALSTMISNDLVMPVLLRLGVFHGTGRRDLSRLILYIRRAGIAILLLLGYAFFRLVGEAFPLVRIGLIAFCGVAQIAPPIIAGLYWKQANLAGATAGLLAGVAVWLYTLVAPALAAAGLLDAGFVTHGLGNLALLRPQALFGMEGLSPVAHAAVWSLGVNIVLLVLWSLLAPQGSLERIQAVLFVDVEQRAGGTARLWRGEAKAAAVRDLLIRFLGQERADGVFELDFRRRRQVLAPDAPADAQLIQLAERQLARAIGAASARVMMGSVVRGEVIGPDDLMQILDETSQVIQHSQQLEQKSLALERATAELQEANERLRQLDQLKDDFISTVSHELRTPLTSIRSFSEILLDTPDLDEAERAHFLQIVVRESERLTRLINDVLDLSKIESGRMEWSVSDCDLRAITADAVAATHGLFAERGIQLTQSAPPTPLKVRCDKDRMIQVIINLLSNASKFVPEGQGRVHVELAHEARGFRVRVEDNGPGVPQPYREAIFEKFRQVASTLKEKPKGTGLGLTICRTIVEHFGGRIWAEDSELGGAAICFTLPAAATIESVAA